MCVWGGGGGGSQGNDINQLTYWVVELSIGSIVYLSIFSFHFQIAKKGN